MSYIKPIPVHEKIYAVGKSGPTTTLNLFFLGLGWPWVGEFVGFIIIFLCCPTQQNLVNRKHPISLPPSFCRRCPLRIFGIMSSRYCTTVPHRGGCKQIAAHGFGGWSVGRRRQGKRLKYSERPSSTTMTVTAKMLG